MKKVFSSPLQKYRKSSYDFHPGVDIAHMLKFLGLYVMYMLTEQIDTMPVHRNWSEYLCCTIMTPLNDLEIEVMDVKAFVENFQNSLSLEHVDGCR